MIKKFNFINKRFGKLVVVKYLGIKPRKKDPSKTDGFWKCLCDCGKITKKTTSALSSKTIKSCGCLHKFKKGEATFNAIFYSYQFRAQRKKLEFKLTKEQFRQLTKQNCFYCGTEPSQIKKWKECNGYYKYNGLDRVNPKKGYTLNNCVSCCKICNYMKIDLKITQFLKHVTKIYIKNKKK